MYVWLSGFTVVFCGWDKVFIRKLLFEVEVGESWFIWGGVMFILFGKAIELRNELWMHNRIFQVNLELLFTQKTWKVPKKH